MTKVSGPLMLIGLCFLVSMTLSAGPIEATNGFALESANEETKIIVKEEVTEVNRISVAAVK